MSVNVQVVAATKPSVGGRGEYPSRYVVLRWISGSAHPFSRHEQIFDGKHDDYFIYGHYHCHLETALEDMIKSMNDNNKSFPKHNISYIPGIDASVNGYFKCGAWMPVLYEPFILKGMLSIRDVFPISDTKPMLRVPDEFRDGYFRNGAWIAP